MIVAYDNLSYYKKFGNWGIEPAVIFSYRKFKDSTHNQTVTTEDTAISSSSGYSSSLYTHMFLFNTILHRLSVDYLVNNSQFSWHTGINATTLKRTYDLVFEPNASTGGNGPAVGQTV